jgi:hypothetical protein
LVSELAPGVFPRGFKPKAAGTTFTGLSSAPITIGNPLTSIDDTFSKRCDPLFTTTKTSYEQPLSIMKDGGGYMYLTPDDEDCVRRLFLRFSSARAAD